MSPLQVAQLSPQPEILPFVTIRSLSKGAPIEIDAPFPEPPFNYLSEFPVNGPPMILNRIPVEKGAHLQSLRKAQVGEPPT